MDYSKLTPEQLLEMLKNANPEYFNDLITNRGYDPYLILDQNVWQNESPMRESDQLMVAHPKHSMDSLEGNPDYFYSDSIDPNRSINSQLEDLVNEYYSPYDDSDIDYNMILENNYPAASSADFFNRFSDEDLLKLLPKDDGPLFDFNIYDLVDDYEGNAEAVDRHLKRNKNFRWD